jgi:hypothetical protein
VGKHAGLIAVVSAVAAVALTAGLVWWMVTSTKESVCAPVLRLVEKPQPAGLTPPQVASFEYNRKTYVQLYASLDC